MYNLQDIRELYKTLEIRNQEFIIYWITSYVGLLKNDVADWQNN